MRLNELLTASAARTPNAVALIDARGSTIDYSSLAAFAAEVAARLSAAGVRDGDRVGLCMPKSIAAIACLFGILQARAAYVPVDCTAPPSRNAYIFGDCSVKAVLGDARSLEALRPALAAGDWRLHDIASSAPHARDLAMLAPPAAAQDAGAAQPDLAYILYTSGSTGQPKGVMHSHASAFSFIDWCSREFEPQAGDRFSSHAPLHFDLSILDVFVAIKHGASIVLIDAETGKQPAVLAQLIADSRITMWYSTPSILRMLLEYGRMEAHDYSALRIVNYAGEVFPVRHLRALMSVWPRAMYYNLYGPTETNVCTFYKLPSPLPDGIESVPIGRACSGDDARVVAEDGTDVPPGAEGELVVSGGSVMLGYWNLPERNRQAFLEHAGRRWYRTGDVVRADDAGEHVFLGRRDRMVKRRGYRVELGEIESALHRHPSIGAVAAVATTSPEGEVSITAFLTWHGADKPSTVALKQFSSKHLPLYMIPDRFSVLPELPKTSTDKVDYQKLKGLV